VFSLLTAGCGSQKTIRKANELAAKLKIYGRNIAKANNEGFTAGDVSSDLHLTINKAIDRYLHGVAVYEAGIGAAKAAIENGSTPKSQLDLLQHIFDDNVVTAFTALADSLVTLPPDLAAKIQAWVAAIRLAINAFRALVLQANLDLKQTEVNHA
jgi:hypothetical protein